VNQGAKQVEQFSQWAESEGWTRAAAEVRAQAETRLRRLAGCRGRFTDCWSYQDGNVVWVIGEAELQMSPAGSSSRLPFLRHFVLIAEADDAILPPFRIRPAATVGISILSGIVAGDQQLFSDDREFQARFKVSTDRVELVRECLDYELRRTLLSSPLEPIVVARPRHLLTLIKSESLGLEERQSLRELAHALFTGLTRNAANHQDLLTQTLTREDRLAMADEVGGLSGLLQRKLLETSCFDGQELDEFLTQPTPRSVPKCIASVFEGDRFLHVFCLLFGCAALAAAGILGMVLEPEPKRYLVQAVCGFVAVVFLGGFAWLRSRAKRRRDLLRTGTVVAASVDRVDETSFVSGNERVYTAAVRLSESGRVINARVQGRAAGRLLDLAGGDQEVQVLQDQLDPEHVLVIGAYVL